MLFCALSAAKGMVIKMKKSLNEFEVSVMKNRIKELRGAALLPKICYEEFHLNFYRYFDKIQLDESNYGDAFLYAFSKITPVIDDGELIVGKTVSELTGKDREEWDTKYYI